MIQIKNRFSLEVIFESKKDTVKEAVREAIVNGTGLRYAKLYNANLEGTDLEGTDLRYADLEGTDLRYANLYNADLEGTDLEDANLRGANLYNANLRGTNLKGANLRGTNLYNANLRGTNLNNADLYNANLRYADLEDANLEGANLRGTNLRGANLDNANLEGADLLASGNMKELRTMQIDTYKIGFTLDTLQIGCRRHKIEEWKSFSDEEIAKMDDGALEWWNKFRPIIFNIIEVCYEDKWKGKLLIELSKEDK
jgi:hypothetical protein